MSTQSFLQRNLSLVAGVTLPLALVLLFWLATLIPRWLVEPPQYDLLLSTLYPSEGPEINGTVGFELDGGRLYARFQAYPPSDFPARNRLPGLYYFTAATGSLRRIDYDFPDNPVNNQRVPVTALEGQALTGESVAPDGYRFDNSYRGSRGFLFFGGYRYSAKIEKDGRALKIPAIDGNDFFGNHQFVAWVGATEP